MDMMEIIAVSGKGWIIQYSLHMYISSLFTITVICTCPFTMTIILLFPAHSKVGHYAMHFCVNICRICRMWINAYSLIIHVHFSAWYVIFPLFLCTYVCFFTACNNGDLRLVNGSTATEGRVELCINNTYGSVCDNRWGLADAEVVCRQLELPTTCKLLKILCI